MVDGNQDIELKKAVNFLKWDPTDSTGEDPLEGWIFPGFLAFVCYGPSLKHFALTVKMGGFERFETNERSTMSKNVKEWDNMARNHGGLERRVSRDLQMRIDRSEVAAKQMAAQLKMENNIHKREVNVIAIGK